MKDYTFERHLIEVNDYEKWFDEKKANSLLREIRNTLQIFKRLYSERQMTTDLWVQIDRVDHLAHGGPTNVLEADSQ